MADADDPAGGGDATRTRKTRERSGGGGADVPRDAFVARLVQDPAQVPEQQPVVLAGYVGDSDQAGHTRVYCDAALSAYVDVPNEAILHHEPLEGGAPRGGRVLWVSQDAEIVHGRRGAEGERGSFFAGPLVDEYAGGGGAPGAGITAAGKTVATVCTQLGCPRTSTCPPTYEPGCVELGGGEAPALRGGPPPTAAPGCGGVGPTQHCPETHMLGCPASSTCPPATLDPGCPRTSTCPPTYQPGCGGGGDPSTVNCPSFGFTCTAFCTPPTYQPGCGGGGGAPMLRGGPGPVEPGTAHCPSFGFTCTAVHCPPPTAAPGCGGVGPTQHCPSAVDACPTRLCPETAMPGCPSSSTCPPTHDCPSAVDACPTRLCGDPAF
ncbi:MAG TPA: hypothetical protein VFX98_03415 [Longimicrobiaceae bacterium]|nr:hypothetical protein [Longimicrobiaceae bacterium]